MPEKESAAQVPVSEPRATDSDYSTAYAEITGGQDDLISMIAYCLYKRQKREFIVKNKLPFHDPRVRRYHDDLNSERISTLRSTAEARLRDYAKTIENAVVTAMGDEIRTGTVVHELSNRIDDTRDTLNASIKRETVWWKAIIYSMIGGFVLGLVIIAASRMGFMNPFEALPPKAEPLRAPSP